MKKLLIFCSKKKKKKKTDKMRYNDNFTVTIPSPKC